MNYTEHETSLDLLQKKYEAIIAHKKLIEFKEPAPEESSALRNNAQKLLEIVRAQDEYIKQLEEKIKQLEG